MAQSADIPVQLDKALSYLHQIHQFNGAALYAENGKPVYSKAFGYSGYNNHAPLDTRAAFNLGNISGQFWAMGILILQEQGKLHIDDPLEKYIPELKYKGVTLRHLLQHASGIPDYHPIFTRYKETLDTLTNEGLIQLYAKLQLPGAFMPGTQYAYSGTNDVLLSTVIARVSQVSVEQFVEQYIFGPMGFKNTYISYLLKKDAPAIPVTGFWEQNGMVLRNDLVASDGITGDGNVYASTEDLLRWANAWNSDVLVKKSTLDNALRPVSPSAGIMGWAHYNTAVFTASSGTRNGFRHSIYLDRRHNNMLVVLSNSTFEAANQVAENIFQQEPVVLPTTELITNVRVVDGTGVPARSADVRICDQKILDVGQLKPYSGETVVDGGGKILAPGFIDTHSHLEGSTIEHPEALAALNQGVTTIVSGQDGYGSWIDSIKGHIARIPVAINIATYTGQTGLREIAMGGEDQLERAATQTEIDQMKVMLHSEMQKGSLGLSTGLEYAGAYFSTRDEVLQLAEITADDGGRYISHLRSEDVALTEAIEEIIDIGRTAKLPVQISHFKIALKDDWGTAPKLIAWLEAVRSEGVDITADCYPYVFWNSTLKVLFPKTDYSNPVSAQFAVDHTFDPDQSILSRFAANPAYIGKTITQIAQMRQQTAAQTIMGLIAEADAYEKANPNAGNIETILGKSMQDEDVANLLAWAHTNVCSDGSNGGHPRGYGSFTRVLGYYVRDQKIMSLETAVQKMTGLAAAHVGIRDRGILAGGYYADLVLFDPETVKDNASVQNSKALSDGILKVWVNGTCVYADKKSTGKFTGTFVRR